MRTEFKIINDQLFFQNYRLIFILSVLEMFIDKFAVLRKQLDRNHHSTQTMRIYSLRHRSVPDKYGIEN